MTGRGAGARPAIRQGVGVKIWEPAAHSRCQPGQKGGGGPSERSDSLLLCSPSEITPSLQQGTVPLVRRGL